MSFSTILYRGLSAAPLLLAHDIMLLIHWFRIFNCSEVKCPCCFTATPIDIRLGMRLRNLILFISLWLPLNVFAWLVPPDVLSNSSSLNYYTITTEASTLIDPHTIEKHNDHIGGVTLMPMSEVLHQLKMK